MAMSQAGVNNWPIHQTRLLISTSVLIRFPRRHPVWNVLVVALVPPVLLFDWNWLSVDQGTLRYVDHGQPVALNVNASSFDPAVQATERPVDPDDILPAGSFDGSRLQKIDAAVDLDAKQLKVPNALPLESLRVSLRLNDSVSKLAPFDFGFAGGTIASNIVLDACDPILKTEAKLDFRGIRLDRLMPDKKQIAQGAGLMGASIQLSGAGNSIADAAGNANGRLSATASLFAVDTAQTQILGTGGFDLVRKRFDISVSLKSKPEPKRMGILSLRWCRC